MGQAPARHLAQRGCDLALLGRNHVGLRTTQKALEACGSRVSVHHVDVSHREEVERAAAEVLAYHAHGHLLVNNAGVSLAGPLESVSIEDLEWVFGINFWGTVYGCRCFLPILRKEPRAQIANILSDFALLGFPTKSATCAAKFAGRGFTAALRAELHGTGVGVTAV